MTLEPEITWSCGFFCKLDDDPKTAHFWVQFINFELDSEWMIKLDSQSKSIAAKHTWRRDVMFTGRTMGIEMACPWDDTRMTPNELMTAFLREMKLELKDATQFVMDAEEIESEGDDDD